MTALFPDFLIHLDTLSTTSSAAIAGLGGLFFDVRDASRRQSFYLSLDGATQALAGRDVDADTLTYWELDSHYPLPIPGNVPKLAPALDAFNSWVRAHTDPRGTRVWMWSARIEGTILQNAYEQCGLKPPWPYYNLWEARTLCRAVSNLCGHGDFPTPHGDTPVAQMNRRADAIIEAEQVLSIGIDRTRRIA